MRREKDIFSDKQVCHFLTFNTVDSVDIFIRPVYKQIIVHSLNHFIDHKELSVLAWCLMTNQLHLLICADDNSSVANIENEFKTFTTVKIQEALETEPGSRKAWILDRFRQSNGFAGLTKTFTVWQSSTSPVFIELGKRDTLVEYFEYIHSSPVRDRIVDTECDYLYSSARDYSGMQGLVHIAKVPVIDQLVASDTTSGFFGKFIRY